MLCSTIYAAQACCFLDVSPFLAPYSDSAPRELLLAKIASRVASESPPPRPLRWLQRFTCACQWRLGCYDGCDAPFAQRRTVAFQWLGAYWAHLPLSAELEPRERGHGDVLPLLASQLLVGRLYFYSALTPYFSLVRFLISHELLAGRCVLLTSY